METVNRLTSQQIGVYIEEIARSLGLHPSAILSNGAARRMREQLAEELRHRGIQAETTG
jgi:hypothetical protein